MINLIVIALCWLTLCFNYFLIQFLINTFSQVYLSGMMAALSELFGSITAYFIISRVGVKNTFLVGFGLATLGGALILGYGLQH